MTYSLTKKDKEFARWLIERARADDLADPHEQFLCIPIDSMDRPQSLVIVFEGPAKQLHYNQGLGVIDSLIYAGFLIRLPGGKGNRYKIIQSLFALVDSNFEESAPMSVAASAQSEGLLVEVSHSALLRLTGKQFNSEELERLCFNLGVDHEEFEQKGKSSVARQLIQYMNRHGRLRELIATILKERPNIDWSPLFKD